MPSHDSTFLAEQLALVAGGYRLQDEPPAVATQPAHPTPAEYQARLSPTAAAELNRARECVRSGDLLEGRIAANRAVERSPDSPDARAMLGALLLETGDAAGALDHLHAAARLAPHWAAAARLCGEAAAAVNDLQSAREHFQRALGISPDWSVADFRLGETLIKAGDFTEGFERLEKRFAVYNQQPPAPAWDGEAPLWDKTVVIVPEREISDLVQFVRYADLLKKRGATVLVVCPADLKGIVESVPGVSKAVPQGMPLPAYDYIIPLLSLPRVFGTTLGTVPAEVPYIYTDDRFIQAWKTYLTALSPKARLRVGLVWADPGESTSVPVRSVPLIDLEPLWRVPDVAWFALQQGPPHAELAANRTPLVDLSGQLLGADAVVAAVGALDLLIGVDTPAVHVKGASANRPGRCSRPRATGAGSAAAKPRRGTPTSAASDNKPSATGNHSRCRSRRRSTKSWLRVDGLIFGCFVFCCFGKTKSIRNNKTPNTKHHKMTASASISIFASPSISLATSTMLVAGRISPNTCPWTAATCCQSATFVTNMRVRTTSSGRPPRALMASRTMASDRAVCLPRSAS
ncbi:MAG: hypothetical protein QM754_09885 [Tepidisphaeraceae bacterium]